MNTHTLISSRMAAAAAMAAGVVISVGGVIQVTHEQSSETTTIGAIEHLGLGTFTGMLALLIPVVLYLGELAGRRRSAGIAATGLFGLAILTVISNVRGAAGDPSYFAAVAIPANLMIFGGLIALAVALKRSGALPAPLAVGLAVIWIVCVPLASLGGMVVAGAYWFTLGWLVRHGEIPRPVIAASQTVRA